MGFLRRFKVREHERGLLFEDGEFKGVLRPRPPLRLDPLRKVRVDVVSQRDAVAGPREARRDRQVGRPGRRGPGRGPQGLRAGLVWIDGRSARAAAGPVRLLDRFHDVRVEVVDARAVRFEHADLPSIAQARGAAPLLEAVTVEAGHAGLFFKDGRHEETLPPGAYAFWKNVAKARIVDVDLREQVVDVAGQEIMTADKVTLRLNAVVTYRWPMPGRPSARWTTSARRCTARRSSRCAP